MTWFTCCIPSEKSIKELVKAPVAMIEKVIEDSAVEIRDAAVEEIRAAAEVTVRAVVDEVVKAEEVAKTALKDTDPLPAAFIEKLEILSSRVAASVPLPKSPKREPEEK